MPNMDAVADTAWINDHALICELDCVVQSTEIILMPELSLTLPFISLSRHLAFSSRASCAAVF